MSKQSAKCIDVLAVDFSGDRPSDRPAAQPSITATSSYNENHYSEQRVIDCCVGAYEDDRTTYDKVWKTFEPYVKESKPLKIMDWRQVCSSNDSNANCMASPDPKIPEEALSCNITVQCRRARSRPTSQMTAEEKQIHEARLRIDAALSIADRSGGDESNLFLGQEDQITTRMSLGDVVSGRYDADLMNICVAQETIMTSPQSEISTSIVVYDNGRVWKMGDSGTATESLTVLAPWVRAPAFLLPPNNVRVREINLWYAPKETRTNTHYDGNDNILVVLKGTKTIELCPPDIIKGSPIHSEHANHPALWRALEVGGNCPVVPSFDEELQTTSKCYKNTAIVVSVSAGEAIFIPEGWWHRVESSVDCLAINFWFDHQSAGTSAFAQPCTSHVLPYQIREIMRTYMDTNFDRIALDLMKEAQSNEDGPSLFLPSSEQKERGVNMMIIQSANQAKFGRQVVGCDQIGVDWKRVVKDGYSNDDIMICQKNIRHEIASLQLIANGARDLAADSVMIDLSNRVDSIGLMLSIFLIYVQPSRENDRRAVLNIFEPLLPMHSVKALREWLYLEIVLRLQRQACFVLSQVWELHRPTEAAEKSCNSLFSSCLDVECARKHVLGQVESFKQEVVQRLVVRDLVLISGMPCGGIIGVVETDDRGMRGRLLAFREEHMRLNRWEPAPKGFKQDTKLLEETMHLHSRKE